ncbi:DEAD/DEAH box helicase [Candidatus Micrarchaeota archaeon]|nr:DEAD/DEAH box helicase [Candidatus Micrarchaeota archaeon]
MKLAELPLKPPLLRAINELGLVDATDIQTQCIPEIMTGNDLVGHSRTGSGKTAAFGLPILDKIEPGKGVQALILTPTRELCVQVAESLSDYSKFMRIRIASVYGGVSINPQIDAVKHADIIVGTTGRILDHIDRRTIDFRNTRFLVLDEADRMLDMGFIEDVEAIMGVIPSKRQTLLFSATMPGSIYHLIKEHLRYPVTITGEVYVDKRLLRQVYYDVEPEEKFSLLVHLLKKHLKGLSLIFCATRREVDTVTRNLKENGLNTLAIHGGLTQSRRTNALNALKKERISILVATDVAARGLDIRSVSHVYNYDVPGSPEEYLHRVGRTARAGDEGDAVTLVTYRDFQNFRAVTSDRTLEIIKLEKPLFERVRFQRHSGQRGGGRRPFSGRPRPHHRDGGSNHRPERWGGGGRRFHPRQQQPSYRGHGRRR